MGKKLQQEMPQILAKCNKIYLERAAEYGRENIWSVLPHYFKETQSEMAAATNPLIHFLQSGKLKFDENVWISEKEFVNAFNCHCQDSNYKKHRINPDFYMGPFLQYGIKIEKNVKRRYPPESGRYSTGTFFIGVDVVSDEVVLEGENKM